MEVLSFLCDLLLGGATVPPPVSDGLASPDYFRIFNKHWRGTGHLFQMMHGPPLGAEANPTISAPPGAPLGLVFSSQTQPWMMANDFLGRSPSSLYGSLWVSLRCWLASSEEHACPPSSVLLCSTLSLKLLL